MKDDYPRPENDSTIGLVYAPPGHGYDVKILQGWIPELESMGVGWLVLLADGLHPIPEGFIGRLVAKGIEPVVGLHPPLIKPFNQAALKGLLETYVRVGVHYVYAYNEPNMMRSWAWGDWSAEGLVSRFMESLIPCLQRACEVGLYPLLSPLRPGGDYWDLAFLKGMLRRLREESELLDRMVIAIQSYTFHHPLNWGMGGRSEWRGTWPYHAPSGCQDHLGVRLFEWYDEIVREILGYSLPMMSIAGGTAPEEEIRDGEAHAREVRELVQTFGRGGLPSYLFNQTVGLLMAGDSRAGQAWHKPDGTAVEAARILKDSSQDPEVQAEGTSNGRGVYHYLLLPSWEKGESEGYRQIVRNYLRRFGPSCGFDLQEAASARYVTILCSDEVIGKKIEAYLEERGCEAERICGQDVAEMQRILDQMAETGKRFLALKEDRDG